MAEATGVPQGEPPVYRPWWARPREAPPPAVLRTVVREARFEAPGVRRLWCLADLLRPEPR